MDVHENRRHGRREAWHQGGMASRGMASGGHGRREAWQLEDVVDRNTW